MPQHNRINISQAKWSETVEVKATVLEMTLVTERWLFCFFFVVVCVIKYFSSNLYAKSLTAMSYINDEVIYINLQQR